MGYLLFLRQNANWLGVGLILAFTSSFGQTFFISVFAGEIMQTFSLTHGQWGGAYTLGTAASALVMVWAGGLTDRFRIRVIAPVIFLGLAASCLFMAYNPLAILLPVVIFALRFTGQGMSSHMMAVSMSRWFTSNRGRALAVASMGFAIGQAVMPIVFVQAKSIIDWRSLWVISAAISAFAIVPLLMMLKQERTPQSHAEASTSLGMNERHWTRVQMVRHPLFWFLVPAILGPAAWNTALFFQQVHVSEIKGWNHADFVALLPLYTAVSVAATFASGWAVDRFGAGWMMAAQGLPMVLGFSLLWSSDSLFVAAWAMSFIAISAGSMATLPGSFAAEFYGTRYLGGIKSIWTAIMVLGSALGPGLSGFLIDVGYDFSDQMLGIAGYFIGSSLLLFAGVAKAKSSSALAS